MTAYGRVPLYAWSAILRWAKDDSSAYYRDRGQLWAIDGHVSLLPDRKKRTIAFGTKTYSLETYFRCFKDGLMERILALPENGYIFVTGDLDTRHTEYSTCDYKHLTTSISIDDILIDESKGTISAHCATLLSPNIDEFTLAADSRFDFECPRCRAETKEVMDFGIRYCPACDR